MANPIIGTLTTEVNETIGVAQSATIALNGVQARIDTAVATAIANGASAEDLAPLTDLSAALDAETNALAAAVAANQGPTDGPSARRK